MFLKNVLLSFQGMQYLHSSPIKFHGRLTSHNCLIDNRWTCKITDYGLRLFRATKNKLAENYLGIHLECFPRTFHYRKLWKPTYNTSKFPFYINITGDLWTAPEILRMRDAESSTILQGTSLADIYSFGVIIQEIVTREGPYAAQLCHLDAQGKTRMLSLQ